MSEQKTEFERSVAIREGHKIHSETSYFTPRPQLDFENARHVFGEGFDRGYIAATAEANKRVAELEAVIETYTANANHAVDIHAKDAETIASLKARALEESNKYVAYCDLAETKISELESDNKIYAECNAELKEKLQHAEMASNAEAKFADKFNRQAKELQASNQTLREALETIATESHYELWQVQVATKALAITPAESLQAFENSVIEKIINIIKSEIDKFNNVDSLLYIIEILDNMKVNHETTKTP